MLLLTGEQPAETGQSLPRRVVWFQRVVDVPPSLGGGAVIRKQQRDGSRIAILVKRLCGMFKSFIDHPDLQFRLGELPQLSGIAVVLDGVGETRVQLDGFLLLACRREDAGELRGDAEIVLPILGTVGVSEHTV